MGLLTEDRLRRTLKLQGGEYPEEFRVEEGTIVTPAARAFLSDNKILLLIGDEQSPKEQESTSLYQEIPETRGSILPKYLCPYGGVAEKKPEHLTHIFGNKLVPKNHRRIVFRGKIDSLECRVLKLQVLAEKSGKEALIKDLEEILAFLRNILRGEVLGEELGAFSLIGLTQEEIHKMSHNPKEYFGVDHLLPSYTMGEVAMALNSLRSAVREGEIMAFNAFITEDQELERPDIIQHLNRLSSCLYVMMYKEITHQYGKIHRREEA